MHVRFVTALRVPGTWRCEAVIAFLPLKAWSLPEGPSGGVRCGRHTCPMSCATRLEFVCSLCTSYSHASDHSVTDAHHSIVFKMRGALTPPFTGHVFAAGSVGRWCWGFVINVQRALYVVLAFTTGHQWWPACPCHCATEWLPLQPGNYG